jgi:hypothetical protein
MKREGGGYRGQAVDVKRKKGPTSNDVVNDYKPRGSTSLDRKLLTDLSRAGA